MGFSSAGNGNSLAAKTAWPPATDTTHTLDRLVVQPIRTASLRQRRFLESCLGYRFAINVVWARTKCAWRWPWVWVWAWPWACTPCVLLTLRPISREADVAMLAAPRPYSPTGTVGCSVIQYVVVHPTVPCPSAPICPAIRQARYAFLWLSQVFV